MAGQLGAVSASPPPITHATQRLHNATEERLSNTLNRLREVRIRLGGALPEVAPPAPGLPEFGSDGYLGENYHSIYRIASMVDILVYEIEKLEALGPTVSKGDPAVPWREDQEAEQREAAGWHGDYNGENCVKCNRLRVMLCNNGKRACEKCRWSPELDGYVSRSYLP